MNKTLLLRKTAQLFLLIIILALNSCTKNEDSIGLDFQPPSDRLGTNFSDSTEISAYSVIEDSIVTSGLSQNVVGWINDPFFGITQAGFATQFHLPSRDVQFSGNPVLDSVVLVISYRGFYGDTNSGVNFKVYELDESLSSSATYHQFFNVNTKQKPLNNNPSLYYQTRISTPIMSATDTTNAQFRIKLKTSWGQSKIFDKSGQSELFDNTNFKEYFKGLLITAENSIGAGHMVYLGINKSTVSGIYFYYHTTESNQTFRLLVEDDCVRANKYDHKGYASATVQFRNQVLNHDTTLGAQELYLQPGGGVNAYLKFPSIREQFKDRRVIINRAELVITNMLTNRNGFYCPQKITLAKNSGTGSYQFIPDDAITEGDAYFGGMYNAATNDYRFRITRYIQQLINSETPDYGLTMFISGRSIYGNRLIFSGYNPTITSSKNKPLRLELSYTYLD